VGLNARLSRLEELRWRRLLEATRPPDTDPAWYAREIAEMGRRLSAFKDETGLDGLEAARAFAVREGLDPDEVEAELGRVERELAEAGWPP
jgi:hypothetical protein